jgi:hypothetical protein
MDFLSKKYTYEQKSNTELKRLFNNYGINSRLSHNDKLWMLTLTTKALMPGNDIFTIAEAVGINPKQNHQQVLKELVEFWELVKSYSQNTKIELTKLTVPTLKEKAHGMGIKIKGRIKKNDLIDIILNTDSGTPLVCKAIAMSNWSRQLSDKGSLFRGVIKSILDWYNEQYLLQGMNTKKSIQDFFSKRGDFACHLGSQVSKNI